MLKALINDTLYAASPKLWLDLNIARKNRNFETAYWMLPQLCARDAVSLDVGGNSGWFAYYMARLSREVQVFEPNPICLAQLERVKTRNMIINPGALSDHAGSATMRFDPKNTGIGTIEAANKLDNNPGIKKVVELEVPIRTLDSFGLTNVAFIKVDVEGHEPAVLRGAKALLAENRPALLMEIELRHNPAAFDEVWAVLDPLGYTMQACAPGGLVPVDRAHIADLQQGRPDTNPDYIYNFVFFPPGRTGL